MNINDKYYYWKAEYTCFIYSFLDKKAKKKTYNAEKSELNYKRFTIKKTKIRQIDARLVLLGRSTWELIIQNI